MSSIEEMTLYGEYNWQDPIYKVLRRETASPRFKIYLMKKGVLNLLFYQYTDMLAMRLRGGGSLDDIMRRQRRLLVDEGYETKANKAMHDNMKQRGIPYKDLEEQDYRYGDVWAG